jgi:phenylalanyl-tRNA synthetase beta chain
LTTVDILVLEPYKIVCGAANVDCRTKVPVATIGTVLYDKEGGSFNNKRKTMQQESHGMICAEDELGLGESHDGI